MCGCVCVCVYRKFGTKRGIPRRPFWHVVALEIASTGPRFSCIHTHTGPRFSCAHTRVCVCVSECGSARVGRSSRMCSLQNVFSLRAIQQSRVLLLLLRRLCRQEISRVYHCPFASVLPEDAILLPNASPCTRVKRRIREYVGVKGPLFQPISPDSRFRTRSERSILHVQISPGKVRHHICAIFIPGIFHDRDLDSALTPGVERVAVEVIKDHVIWISDHSCA